MHVRYISLTDFFTKTVKTLLIQLIFSIPKTISKCSFHTTEFWTTKIDNVLFNKESQKQPKLPVNLYK
jgi:hypothetical protein